MKRWLAVGFLAAVFQGTLAWALRDNAPARAAAGTFLAFAIVGVLEAFLLRLERRS